MPFKDDKEGGVLRPENQECEPGPRIAPIAEAEEPDAAAPPAAGGEDGAPGAGSGLSVPEPSMAESVTRHALITEFGEVACVAAGIDSLDLGVYVDWSKVHPWVFPLIEATKENAKGGDGIYLHGLLAIVLPAGNRMYAFHLQFADFHLFLKRPQSSRQQAPNVMASISAKSLWLNGPLPSVDLVRKAIEEFGGKIEDIRPSRVDLCADFHIPHGLTLDFLNRHQVMMAAEERHQVKLGRLETFYSGSTSSPIQLRIYDKTKEILATGEKLWFADVWKRESVHGVWRVEYQLRRPFLKRMGINTLNDLFAKAAGTWVYLTRDWYSLRDRQADTNISRCPMHPLWKLVSEAAARFGVIRDLKPVNSKAMPSLENVLPQIAGRCLTWAAKKQIAGIDDALFDVSQFIKEYWKNKGWDIAYLKKSIELGFNPAEDDAKEPDGAA